MQRALTDFASGLLAADDRGTAFDISMEFFRAHGFACGIFVRISETDPVAEDVVGGELTEFWRYWCRNRWDLRDPTVLNARSNTEPLALFTTEEALAAIKGGRELMAALGDHACPGIFATSEPRIKADIERGRVGMLSIGSQVGQDEFHRIIENLGPMLELASHFVLARMAELPGGVAITIRGEIVPDPNRAPRVERMTAIALSPREADCLLLLSRGLRNDRIAERLGIAPSTVEMHLSGARRKLGARTREQAVAIAVLNGAIAP